VGLLYQREACDITRLACYLPSSQYELLRRFTFPSPPATTTTRKHMCAGYTKPVPWSGSYVQLLVPLPATSPPPSYHARGRGKMKILASGCSHLTMSIPIITLGYPPGQRPGWSATSHGCRSHHYTNRPHVYHLDVSLYLAS
jgi:hypothetical protein